jgi:hypothetical protein
MRASHVDSELPPKAVTHPYPVTTTLFVEFLIMTEADQRINPKAGPAASCLDQGRLSREPDSLGENQKKVSNPAVKGKRK